MPFFFQLHLFRAQHFLTQVINKMKVFTVVVVMTVVGKRKLGDSDIKTEDGDVFDVD